MTLKDTILYGDCRETLNNLTNLSIQTCVTSPPYYGLRDYGGEKNQIGQEQSPEEFIDELVKVFRIVRDKLKARFTRLQ
jgi:DNA modification methylase